MPELPEVETTRLRLLPISLGCKVSNVIFRRPDLRWPIAPEAREILPGKTILSLRRRAKYLLLDVDCGSLLIHLGMSGCLRAVPMGLPSGQHDHVDLVLDTGYAIRFTDPRRFGCLLWQPFQETHALLRNLGPEPLSTEFTGDYLYEQSRNRTISVKALLMDQGIVVGVGNIYAAETLFRAGINPARPAGKISRLRYARLALAVKEVLRQAVESGITTLKELQHPNGMPKYFKQELLVYGRLGAPCTQCGRTLVGDRLGNRATVWCAGCQR